MNNHLFAMGKGDGEAPGKGGINSERLLELG
jgi:hypothetical protein